VTGTEGEVFMNEKLLILLGTWILCDAIFSLYTYLGKEGFKENMIRGIRLWVGMVIIYMGFFR